MYRWKADHPEFAEDMRLAREALAERFSDLGWTMALEATPETVSKLAWNIASPARCAKPVIVANRGYCFGVGFELSLACDFRIASETTQYALPEQKLGQIPGSGGSARLQKMIGITRTKDIVMRSKRIPARQALEWGIVTECVADKDLEAATDKLVDELRTFAPLAQRTAKKLLNDTEDSTLSIAIELEGHCYSRLRTSDDFREGVEALARNDPTPEQVDDFGAGDEVEPGQGHDPVAVERRLEGEVEPGERLDHGEPSHAQCCLDPAVLTQRQFLRQQFVERLDAIDLTLFDAAQGGIEHLECSRHPQADQTVADIVDPRRWRRDRHGRLPVARWLPIAS